MNPEFSLIDEVTAPNVTVGALSSSVIVNVPVESLIVAFDGLDKVIVTVSSVS
jgi:hypothetical protein